MKNRKPILQTKVQKTAKLTNRKENHGLRNNTEGTVLGRKKANLFANLFTYSSKWIIIYLILMNGCSSDLPKGAFNEAPFVHYFEV
ncbi:hypothetical protein B7692_04490 [Streptococcus mitis]|uniref:Uncharacterized protein n=1 Tax=Streptococcus mitis TaxID=28037 RepID=A0A1X1L6X1_STRMT|nr:hypothetical protein B7692_04490 [Streptococcus mitis]